MIFFPVAPLPDRRGNSGRRRDQVGAGERCPDHCCLRDRTTGDAALQAIR